MACLPTVVAGSTVRSAFFLLAVRPRVISPTLVVWAPGPCFAFSGDPGLVPSVLKLLEREFVGVGPSLAVASPVDCYLLVF